MKEWTEEDEEFFSELVEEFQEKKEESPFQPKPLGDIVSEISSKTKNTIDTINGNLKINNAENPMKIIEEKKTENNINNPMELKKPKKTTSSSKWFEQNKKVFEKEMILDKYEEFIIEKEQELLEKIVTFTNPDLARKIFKKKVSE